MKQDVSTEVDDKDNLPSTPRLTRCIQIRRLRHRHGLSEAGAALFAGLIYGEANKWH